MDFNSAIQLVQRVLEGVGSTISIKDYDGLIVKKLESSNTLDSGRTTKQSHIAITGDQMDMFPYVRADGYFEVEYEKEDNGLKKYFVAQIPVYIHKENVTYLDSDAEIIKENEKLVYVSIVRSRRKDAADQIQMSMTYMDSPEYVQYRRAVHTGSYMVMLKRTRQLVYDLFAVKEVDITAGSDSLKYINNQFFKLPTNTVVKLDEIIVDDKKEKDETTDRAETMLEHYKALNLIERKNVFIEWMGKRKKSKPEISTQGDDADHYSESVIKSYATFLVNRAERLKDFPYENTNLFYYVDPTEYAEVVKAAMNAPNYPEVNEKCITKGFGPAMKRYAEFLEYLADGSKQEPGEISKDKVLKNCLEIKRSERSITIHPLNCIIYGAPGTGKTYSTAEYALAIIENRPVDKERKDVSERKKVMAAYNDYMKRGQIVFTTFHQSYGYEEFIQGLRPDTKSEGMSFKPEDGTFKRIADIALNDPVNNYVIIIDEINRANISKVFGELITLIEGDKRWGEVNETCVTLQLGDVFAVPNNLYIVGTMNSADKSISLIDAALRRRFEFIEQHPEPLLVDDPVLRSVLIKLNDLLADAFGSSDLLIGHSYFMGKDKDALCKIMNNSIIPLLYEYFYDNKKNVVNTLKKSLEGLGIEVRDEKISRVFVKKVNKKETAENNEDADNNGKAE